MEPRAKHQERSVVFCSCSWIVIEWLSPLVADTTELHRSALPSVKDSWPSCEDHLLTPSGPPQLSQRLRQKVGKTPRHSLSAGTSLVVICTPRLSVRLAQSVRSAVSPASSSCSILFLQRFCFPRFIILTSVWLASVARSKKST